MEFMGSLLMEPPELLTPRRVPYAGALTATAGSNGFFLTAGASRARTRSLRTVERPGCGNCQAILELTEGLWVWKQK